MLKIKKTEKADLNANISEWPILLIISITKPINHCITNVPANINKLNEDVRQPLFPFQKFKAKQPG